MLKKLKEKRAARKEGEDTTNVEEEEADNETEVKNIKMVNYIRNQFIARGYVGSITMSRESFLTGQEYSIDVGEGDTPVTDPPFAYENENDASTVLVKITEKLLNNLQKRAHSWRNVPYRDNASITLSSSIPLGPFTIGIELEAEVGSILGSQEKA